MSNLSVCRVETLKFQLSDLFDFAYFFIANVFYMLEMHLLAKLPCLVTCEAQQRYATDTLGKIDEARCTHISKSVASVKRISEHAVMRVTRLSCRTARTAKARDTSPGGHTLIALRHC
ncbi:unnamed protein product [Litomosoides sigmodontis]|uniref:Uncharacterized protein n=1 Tax=Litomosoides sigmodontis TaxID=42156 RepID=A0A3P6VB25_LITSI|nr:unnamed protein product [Litomosoides sigmodontis]